MAVFSFGASAGLTTMENGLPIKCTSYARTLSLQEVHGKDTVKLIEISPDDLLMVL